MFGNFYIFTFIKINLYNIVKSRQESKTTVTTKTSDKKENQKKKEDPFTIKLKEEREKRAAPSKQQLKDEEIKKLEKEKEEKQRKYDTLLGLFLQKNKKINDLKEKLKIYLNDQSSNSIDIKCLWNGPCIFNQTYGFAGNFSNV